MTTGHDEEGRGDLRERRALRKAEARRPWWEREGRMQWRRRAGVMMPIRELVPYSGDRMPVADFSALMARMLEETDKRA